MLEALLGLAASPPLLIGLFVGFTAWLARTVLRDTWVSASIAVTVAVSIIAAGGLLVALRAWELFVPGVGLYCLGLIVSSVIYVGLYRYSEGHWPVRSRPRETPR